MKALGSRLTKGTLCALPLVWMGACATRELPSPHGANSALSLKAKAGAPLTVNTALDAEPGAEAAAPASSPHDQPSHQGHHHGH